MRRLGRTGLLVPPVAFGATSLGNLFREVGEQEKADIVSQWAASGLEPIVIDSAGKYGAGLSLEVIGRELNRLAVPASHVLISNKLGWRRVSLTGAEPTFEPGAWFGLKHDAVQDISYDGILRCFHEGNELLQGYSAQLVSVHDPDEYLAAAKIPAERAKRLQDIIDAYRALTELRDAGEVAAVGVGAKSWQVIHELSEHCDFDWVMFANSFTIHDHPAELVQFFESLASRGVGIFNSALFHGGFLLGGEFFDYRKIDSSNPEDEQRLKWRARFWELCKDMSVTPFDVGVAFGRSHPAITAVALSSSRAERIPSHLDAVNRGLDASVWDAFRRHGLIREDYVPMLDSQ